MEEKMILWHYTSLDALISILSNELPTLRASNVLYLNDRVELFHGLQAIRKIYIEKRLPLQNEFLSAIDPLLAKDYDPEIYSFSFSESEDSLYQWLAYCPKQGGIALGFNIENDSIDKENAFYLKLPNSTNEVQIPQFDKCNYFKNYNEIQPEWLEKVRIEKSAYANLLTMAMFLKHDAFRFEDEHRLFFHPMPDNPHNIQIKMAGIKPYIDFHFREGWLNQIYISPRGNVEITEKAVAKLLNLKNLTHVKISHSEIPYREI